MTTATPALVAPEAVVPAGVLVMTTTALAPLAVPVLVVVLPAPVRAAPPCC